MTARVAGRALLEFFGAPPPPSPPDLGVLFRHGGRNFFLPAARVVEVCRARAVSRLPGSNLGVAIVRGRAIEVVMTGRTASAFVLARFRQREVLLACDEPPRAVSRSAIPAAVAEYSEES